MKLYSALFFFIVLWQHVICAVVPSRIDLPDAIDCILNRFGDAQKGKNLVFVSKNYEMDEEDCHIEKIDFLFDLYETVDIPRARILITSLVNSLLQTVMSSEKLKPYLACHFNADNIIMRIRIRTKECGFIYPVLGNIAYISAMDGRIFYDTLNSYTYQMDNLSMETFQEALRLSNKKRV